MNRVMHELAITESIVRAVIERIGGAPVTRVRLEIGTLSGVVPDALRFCFELCTADTPLAGATLEIVERGGRARCRECGAEIGLDDLITTCPCGSADLELLAGQELLIKEVEIRTED